LHSIYATITAPLSKLTAAIDPLLVSLNCPQLKSATNGGTNILDKWKATYPGVAKAGVAL